MSTPDKQAELQKHAEFWESGKWELHVSHYSRQRIYLVFPAGRPTVSELLAVRSLLPLFSEAPITKSKNEVGNLAEFFVDDFSSLEGRRFVGDARARGLHTRVEGRSCTSYLPVLLDGSGVTVIDHDELMLLIGAEMIRRGVPTKISEED